jgi:hypothetical protein
MGQPMDDLLLQNQPATLDPADWTAFRSQAHHLLDDMLEYTQTLRQCLSGNPFSPTTAPTFAAHFLPSPRA